MTNAEKAKVEAAALGRVETDALTAGTSRSTLLASVYAAAGAKPTLVLFEKVRLAAVVGYMAAALIRKGDNRPVATIRTHCRDRILNYQGANGSGKLRKGQKGRRNQVEEDAYMSARVLCSKLWNDAGVKVPTKSGSNSNSKEKAAAKKTAKGKAAKAEPKSDKPAIRKFRSAEEFVQYALLQGKAMQGSLNKSADVVPGAAGQAINAFYTAMLAVADELGMKA